MNIEKNIPMPESGKKTRFSAKYTEAEKMEVGDSFLIESDVSHAICAACLEQYFPEACNGSSSLPTTPPAVSLCGAAGVSGDER